MYFAIHNRPDHFDDYTYWDKNDGIQYERRSHLPVLIYVSPWSII